MITASLTARQEEILNLIKTNIRATGYPPTRAEIAKRKARISRRACAPSPAGNVAFAEVVHRFVIG